MASCSDPTEAEVIKTVQKSLEREKLTLLCKTKNVHNQHDLSRAFRELDKSVEDIIKAKYGELQHRHEFEHGKLYPMLVRIMERASRIIRRRMCPRMCKLHPWL